MRNRRFSKLLPMVVTGFALSACSGEVGQRLANLDFDLRGTAGGLDTSSAARQATAPRPKADARGVITYPNYQVAVAERGDTVASVAARLGVDAGGLARHNGLRPDDRLNKGELLALPPPVASAPAQGTGTRPLDITEIATTAIGRAPQTQINSAAPSASIDGPEPIRHQVGRGETAYSIARLYNVSARSLADWNGLGADLEVREGQYLLIPVAKDGSATVKADVQQAAVIAPGAGTPTPQPPSAAKPLPDEQIAPKQAAVKAPVATPDAPKPAASSAARLLTPVSGEVLRPYKKRKNEGIDIAASAGTPVKAAADGEVAAITRDTDQVPILVLRHPGNLLTVYANISDITVKKGDKVSRGKTIAKVRSGSPSFLHFEVREGFESVNPASYLK